MYFYSNNELNDCVCAWGCVYYLTLKFTSALWSFIVFFCYFFWLH